MKLLIKNLGPIKNNTQEIDLSKRFYVFVGVNNSGKTYVSQLLWTIFDDKTIHRFARHLSNKEVMNIKIEKNFEITEVFVKNILENFAEFLKNELSSTYNISYNLAFIQNIELLFQFSIEELKTTSVTINALSGSEEKLPEEYLEYLTVTKDVDSLVFQIETKKISESLMNMFSENSLSEIENKIDSTKKELIIQSTITILLKQFYETFFLPASRSFYPSFYRYIYDIERRNHEEFKQKISNLLEETEGNPTNKDIESLRKSSLFTRRPYTKPINQAIEDVYSLNINPEEVSHYINLVERLAEVMGGDILMKSLEGIAPIEFFFKPHKQEKDLPMYLASSSVNQLSLLYLYFKYWVAEENNFLMMDEPEENLHPANQVLLLELLLDFANQNDNRVLITTHSPLLANALNNYVYLDILKNDLDCDLDDIIEEHDLPISSSTSIARDDVGVYFFNGKKIIEYDSGYYSIYFRDFQETTSAIKRSAETLTDYIYYKEREAFAGEDEDE
ncbi:MAG: AAA family ATPase [Cyanobacteria bacterium SBLK]|nr:AAA family ATPase [Cyanobacteria bacterium SBLK]